MSGKMTCAKLAVVKTVIIENVFESDLFFIHMPLYILQNTKQIFIMNSSVKAPSKLLVSKWNNMKQ